MHILRLYTPPQEESMPTSTKTFQPKWYPNGSAHVSPDAQPMKISGETAPRRAISRECMTFQGRIREWLRRTWTIIKRDRKDTTTAHPTKKCDEPPPQYTEVAAEPMDKAPVQDLDKKTHSAKVRRSTVSKPSGDTAAKLNEASVPKPTARQDQIQKPPENSTLVNVDEVY